MAEYSILLQRQKREPLELHQLYTTRHLLLNLDLVARRKVTSLDLEPFLANKNKRPVFRVTRFNSHDMPTCIKNIQYNSSTVSMYAILSKLQMKTGYVKTLDLLAVYPSWNM